MSGELGVRSLNSVVFGKSKRFAVRIVRLYHFLREEKKEYLSDSQYSDLRNDCEEIRKMLSSATKTLTEE